MAKHFTKACLAVLLVCAAWVNAQEKNTPAPLTFLESMHCSDPTDQTAIRDIAELWKDGYNNGNAERVAALYMEDAYYLTQHFITGIIRGRAAMTAYVQRGGDARYRIDSIQTLPLNCSDGFAYAITRYASTNGEQKAFGVNLVVLRKIDGKWYIAAHEAAVPDPATAIRHLDVKSIH